MDGFFILVGVLLIATFKAYWDSVRTYPFAWMVLSGVSCRTKTAVGDRWLKKDQAVGLFTTTGRINYRTGLILVVANSLTLPGTVAVVWPT